MSEDLIETQPGKKLKKMNDSHYKKLADITFKLTERGYSAEAIHPMNGILNLIILASMPVLDSWD